MDRERLAHEVARFDPGIPIERASTPPASWYVDPALYEVERRSVFRDTWQAVARADELVEPGSYVAGDLAGEPWVVLRDAAGRLRAFFNVCRHRATCLLEGAGRTERIVCPYHGWSYDLDGRLRSAPRMGGVRDFDREAHNLVPLDVATWEPLVFVRQARLGPALEGVLGPLAGRIDTLGLRFVARRSWELACNWKVFVDNYLDGGYHVEFLHRGLAAQLDLEGYTSEVHEWLSLQLCGARSGDGATAGVDFRERVGTGAVYAFVYPNLMLNRYGPILDTNLVLPLGPHRTLTVFDYWFDERVAADAAFVERSLEASDRVQREDIAVCERVQRGLGSSAFVSGRYAPTVEPPAHHFHRLLAVQLQGALAG